MKKMKKIEGKKERKKVIPEYKLGEQRPSHN